MVKMITNIPVRKNCNKRKKVKRRKEDRINQYEIEQRNEIDFILKYNGDCIKAKQKGM